MKMEIFQAVGLAVGLYHYFTIDRDCFLAVTRRRWQIPAQGDTLGKWLLNEKQKQ